MPDSDGIPLYQMPPPTSRDFDSLRAELYRHQNEDRIDFKELRDGQSAIKATVDHWEGALGLMKLFAVIGGGSCLSGFGVLLFHVLHHW